MMTLSMPPLAVIALAACVALPALAAQDGPLSESELKGQVGGFMTPTGFEIGFGAVITTYVDGKLALQTQLTWNESGAEQTTQGATAGSELASQAAQGGIQIEGVPGSGVYVPGHNGGTVVLHDFDDGRVAGLIFNTADNRDVRQDTNITLSVPGLDQLQQDVAAQHLDMRLQDAIGRALENATR